MSEGILSIYHSHLGTSRRHRGLSRNLGLRKGRFVEGRFVSVAVRTSANGPCTYGPCTGLAGSAGIKGLLYARTHYCCPRKCPTPCWHPNTDEAPYQWPRLPLVMILPLLSLQLHLSILSVPRRVLRRVLRRRAMSLVIDHLSVP